MCLSTKNNEKDALSNIGWTALSKLLFAGVYIHAKYSVFDCGVYLPRRDC